MNDKEYMELVNKYADTNPLVKKILEIKGHPDNWPEHLKVDLHKRIGIVETKNYELTPSIKDPNE